MTTRNSALLASLSTMTRASATERVAKIAMTDRQVEQLSQKLKDGNRMNVYPNVFDVNLPYRVQTRTGKVFTQHGYFTSVDVATAVGTICSKAKFAEKALAGDYNAEVVADHPEFLAWMDDDRNQEIIARATDIG